MQIVLYKQRHVQLFTVDYQGEQNMLIRKSRNILFDPKIIYYTVDTENTPDFRCQAMPDIRCWISRISGSSPYYNGSKLDCVHSSTKYDNKMSAHFHVEYLAIIQQFTTFTFTGSPEYRYC